MDNPTKYYSNIQESTIADYLGWKQVSGSGARDFQKGDVIGDNWRGECKTHSEPGNKLKFDYQVWSKINEEAKSHFYKPVLFVDDGSQNLDNTWCMCDLLRPDLFTEVQIDWDKRKSLIKDLIELKSLYNSCPYTFLVVNRNGEKFALMPISEFKGYAERLK